MGESLISWNDFEAEVIRCLGRNIDKQNNPEQNRLISSPMTQSLFIVAGPGSGKTTVIVLRILKLIFVDGVDPSNILATTFTRKAAKELGSRILGWGDQLKNSFLNNSSYRNFKNDLSKLDFNRIIIGTLDSIIEEVLGEYRVPGTPPPVVIEDFVAKSLMVRVGLFNRGRHTNKDLKNYVVDKLLNGKSYGLNVSEIGATLLQIKDRFFHDQVDEQKFRNNSSHPGIKVACDAIEDYINELRNRNLFDFAKLESFFLERLKDGSLCQFQDKVQFIFVDEYQDTNLLQESIYFELAKKALQNGGSITVVGDDDQSLYRFRGATVDLFNQFPSRIQNYLNCTPQTVYLLKNYRSTDEIVDFCNNFIKLDKDYAGARVQGKPPIVCMRKKPYTNYPVLGMFRDDLETLAADLSEFIHDVIFSQRVIVTPQGPITIEIDKKSGSAADIALLCSSPKEFSSPNKPRLPGLLRQKLKAYNIKVFNPRGRDLNSIEEVQILCGLILECIDPGGKTEGTINTLPKEAKDMFRIWRFIANSYINQNPPPTNPSLKQFVDAWKNRQPLNKKKWEEEIYLVDLMYKLLTWIPAMQNDIEGLVYLEAITRTITQSALFSNFGAHIIFKNPYLETASIKEAIWNIFVPLAVGAIEVNEDLLETLPPDRVNIMSIHQAKGLEFPLVIVDVGSDFKKNLHTQAFKRFPSNGGKSCNLEDELRPYSPLGRPARSALDRAFDDLIRQYFVAYSRPQDVLLLVGLNSVRNGSIPNVATGWDRKGNWVWQRGLNNLVHI